MNDSFAANTKAAADDLLDYIRYDALAVKFQTRPSTLSRDDLAFVLRFAIKELTTARNECNLAREQLEALKQQIRNLPL
jgi:hypothetical protein